MEISKVHAVFFSPTGNAKQVICTVADAVGAALGVPVDYDDFTLPQARQTTRSYGPGDLVVFGTPTYAGRIPNKLLPFVQSGFQGNGALAVPVAVFGNRSYDNALMELRNELEASTPWLERASPPSTCSATSWPPAVPMRTTWRSWPGSGAKSEKKWPG